MTVDDAYPRTVVLADGAHLVLRPASAADAAARRALRAASPDGARGADAADDPPGTLVVLACDGTRVAGELTLHRSAGDDAATVAVALDPAYRGRRLGTWMLLDAVHTAERLGIRRLVATVGPDDAGLRAALARLDFVEEPAPRRGGGARVMAKVIHVGWTDF